MTMHLFEFLITSPTEREHLCCEIYYKQELIAELSQEADQFLIEIYPPEKNAFWIIPFNEFQDALENAKLHLKK